MSQNRIKRAIIVAAGKGERLRPITLTTPKPLVKVNGKPMIHSVIEALHTNGITEIYVVVGYLKEKFDYLPDLYEGVRIIENPYFDTCNNISSLYVAREHLEDCIIMDGDQIINNKNALNVEFSLSGYNAVYSPGHTSEWLMHVKDGVVTGCSRDGGSNGWRLYSVSRWSKSDGYRLKRLLEYEFEGVKRRDVYWDDIPMFLHPEDFTLGIHEMSDTDVIEIDNLDELKEIDDSYKMEVCE